jgi:hypothetical protein
MKKTNNWNLNMNELNKMDEITKGLIVSDTKKANAKYNELGGFIAMLDDYEDGRYLVEQIEAWQSKYPNLYL